MRSNILLVKVFLPLVLLLALLFIIFITFFGYRDLNKNVLASLTKTPTAVAVVVDKKPEVISQIYKVPVITIGLPVRLIIPAIKVDANVLHLGLTTDGAMKAPKGPIDVSWYSLGPRPGEAGSAVMAGHYGAWKDGSVSVFQNLTKLEKGERVSVRDENGQTINFIVRESKNFFATDDASSVFISNDGKAHLNLITCEGIWNSTDKSYSNRFVVFTDRQY